jgi:hypothetical protein
MSRLRHALSPAALVLASVGLTLAIGEVAARLTWRPPPERQPTTAADPTLKDQPVISDVRGLEQPSVRGVLPNGSPIGPTAQAVADIQGPGYRVHRPSGMWVLAQKRRYERHQRSSSHLLRLLWPRWLALVELVWPDPQSYLVELRDNYFHNPEAWGHFTAGLDRLAAIQQARQVCLPVFIHTHLAYLNVFHPMRAIYDRIGEAAVERGLPVIQSLSVHLGQDERSLHVGPVDPHPNAHGHALLARALLAGLRRLPSERCWR